MQFEVVLRLEGLLADLTLEPSSDAVSGEVASEVSLTWEDLSQKEDRNCEALGCKTLREENWTWKETKLIKHISRQAEVYCD